MKYAGAPYNFVPIADKIYKRYESAEQLPKHNQISKELYSGEIICNIEAITDLFIGSGKKDNHFYKRADGKTCIPGSSLRGLIRNNMQILGFGSIAGDVENYNIMYRTVGSSRTKVAKHYTENILDVKTVLLGTGKDGKRIQTTVPKNVKAGYIVKDGKQYKIYKTEKEYVDYEKFGECNYYPVSELMLMKANEEAKKHNRKRPFSFFDEQNEVLQHTGHSWDFKVEKKGSRVHVRGHERNEYVPYYKPVYYKLKDLRHVESIIKADGTLPTGYEEGYVISTGKMQEKKAFYVVPKCKKDECIPIGDMELASFRCDYENKKNKVHGKLKDDVLKKKCQEFFDLPKKDGQIKPIFYIHLNGRLYFGYTPFLRIFYEHSILHGLSKEQRELMDEYGDIKNIVLDYPSAMLGYATKDQSYKSRVWVEDMELQLDTGKTVSDLEKTVELTQGKPQLSSYMDYLIQNNPECAITYNDDNFKLRGIKQYWLHEKIEPSVNKNVSMKNAIYPLKAGVNFKGKIHFKNMTKDELGLLLWSLSLEADSNQNIGRGKAFGYGRIDLTVEQLKIMDFDKMYDLSQLRMDIFDIKRGSDINDFISAYKEHMNEHYAKEQDIMKEKSIETFLLMKDKTRLPKVDSIRYMNLGDKNTERDYQNRVSPLQTPKEVIEGKRLREIEETKSPSRNDNKNGFHSKNGNYQNRYQSKGSYSNNKKSQNNAGKTKGNNDTTSSEGYNILAGKLANLDIKDK